MKKHFASLRLAAVCAVLVLSGCQSAVPVEEQPAATPVEITRLLRSTIQTEYVYSGQIKPRRQLQVVGKVSGKVKSVHFEVGDMVNEGDVLYVMDEQDIQRNVDLLKAQLESAEAGVETARLSLSLVDGAAMQTQIVAARTGMERAALALSDAQTAYDNSKALFDAGAVSQFELTQAESGCRQAKLAYDQAKESYTLLTSGTVEENRAMAQSALHQAQAGRDSLRVQLDNTLALLSDAAVRAPIPGVVSSRSAEPGAMLSPSLPAFVIIQTDVVTVDVQVSERSVSSLETGQPVEVLVSALGDRPFEGLITLLSPAADEMKNTYLVQIELKNEDGALKPGMLAEARFVSESRENALVLPRGAVLGTGSDTYVFVERNGTAEKVPVQTGIDNGRDIEITGGLSENDAVVTKGQSFLNHLDAVRVVSADEEVK